MGGGGSLVHKCATHHPHPPTSKMDPKWHITPFYICTPSMALHLQNITLNGAFKFLWRWKWIPYAVWIIMFLTFLLSTCTCTCSTPKARWWRKKSEKAPLLKKNIVNVYPKRQCLKNTVTRSNPFNTNFFGHRCVAHHVVSDTPRQCLKNTVTRSNPFNTFFGHRCVAHHVWVTPHRDVDLRVVKVVTTSSLEATPDWVTKVTSYSVPGISPASSTTGQASTGITTSMPIGVPAPAPLVVGTTTYWSWSMMPPLRPIITKATCG